MNPPDSRDIAWAWGPLAWAGFAAVTPYFAARMLFSTKHRAGLQQRLTLYPAELKHALTSGPNLWLHAVSVGEQQAAKGLIERLKEEFPQLKLALSTVTDTGQALARSSVLVDAPLYLPLDLPPLCRRAVRLAKPKAALVMETELWPNFIRALSERDIPIVLINARLSNRSFANYKRARALFAPILQRLSGVLAQSPADAQRFIELGAPAGRTLAAGNLKFDVPLPESLEPHRSQWRKRFHIKDDEIAIVGGSTFAGEELMLARLAASMRSEGAKTRLIIAPRHIERISAIEEEFRRNQLRCTRRSSLPLPALEADSVILLDSIGELKEVYAAVDIVFIGKSIHAKGGQNPIEPASLGRAVVAGPNMQNFRAVTEAFTEANAIERASGESELGAIIARLAHAPKQRERLGERARQVVAANQGALDRVCEFVFPIIHERLRQDGLT